MNQLLLWLNAVVFAGFGLVCALAPALVAEMTTSTIPATTSAMTDFRAVYGGMMIGFGVYLGLCALHEPSQRSGLLAALLVLICMAGSRSLGMLIDGSPNIYMQLYLGAEAFMSLLLVISLRKPASPTQTQP